MDQPSQDYKYANAPRYLLRRDCIRKLIKDIPQGHALDIGCGGGDLCEMAYQLGFSVFGIDFSEEAIAMCKHRLAHLLNDPRIKFARMDVSDLDDTFDLIFMMEVLEHIEHDVTAIEKVAQLLRPGAHLLLSVPANQKWFGPSDHFAGHYRRYDRDQLVNLIRNAGFDVNETWSYGVPLANLTEVVRNFLYRKRAIVEKQEATKQSGINRNIEYSFRFFSNDFFLFPFYLMQRPFFATNLGAGLILKAIKQ